MRACSQEATKHCDTYTEFDRDQLTLTCFQTIHTIMGGRGCRGGGGGGNTNFVIIRILGGGGRGGGGVEIRTSL